jgi:hypothetical protein
MCFSRFTTIAADEFRRAHKRRELSPLRSGTSNRLPTKIIMNRRERRLSCGIIRGLKDGGWIPWFGL